MKEIYGNLWEIPCDLRVITTNGDTNRRTGAAVMGRGCAKETTERISDIQFHFGKLLRRHGNRVMRLTSPARKGWALASFPVKHHWHEEADLPLIRRSAHQLVALADKFGYRDVLLPRPGCGNGRLSWEDVKPVLGEILDDRFTVVTFPPKGAKWRVVRESQRSFNTGDTNETVIASNLSEEQAQARAGRENRLARRAGALAHHRVEPVPPRPQEGGRP